MGEGAVFWNRYKRESETADLKRNLIERWSCCDAPVVQKHRPVTVLP